MSGPAARSAASYDEISWSGFSLYPSKSVRVAVPCIGGTAAKFGSISDRGRSTETRDRLLNRMNSAFFRYLLSRKKRGRDAAHDSDSCKTVIAAAFSGSTSETSRGLPDNQLWGDFMMAGGDLAFFQYRLDAFENNAHCARAHRFHGLAHRCERRSVESRGGNIVEADHRAVLRNAQAGFGKGADGAEGGHIVEGKNCGERMFLLDQAGGEFLTCLEAGKRIARFGQIDDKAGLEFEATCLGAVADAAPAGSTV